MFKFKMSLLFNNLKFRVAMVVLIIAAIAAGIIFIPKNKAGKLNTSLTSNDIIAQACKLVGKDYWVIPNNGDGFEDGWGKGVTNGYVWGGTSGKEKYGTSFKLADSKNFKSLDCTGLIYYTLTSLGCTTNGFSFQNPVPVDTAHWYTYTNPTLTYKGTTSNVNVLKKGVSVENLPYYMCEDGTEIPAGSIVIAAGSKLGANYHDHGWIYLGNLGTVNEKEVAKMLIKDMGVNANLLITGDINGEFNIKTYVNGLGKTVPVIQKTDNDSTYWRIESTADSNGYGVYINNGDPTASLTIMDQNTGKKKAIGPIYAFQIANVPEVIKGNYNVVLKKVKADGTTVITSAEATFKVNGSEKNTTNGILNISKSKEILEENQVDTYEIVETKAPEGYDLFSGIIKLNVKFKKEGNKYLVDNTNTTCEGLPESAKFEVDSNSQTITIYVPNEEHEEQTGNYNVVLKKVKADGTTVITSAEATFKVNGSEKNTTNGILNISKSKEILEENQVDTYEIVETKAPEGYDLFSGIIKLNVKFKKEGNKYLVDNTNTTCEGLPESAKFEVDSNSQTITIYVPNEEHEEDEEQPGKYNVELFKVNEKGEIISTPAKFEVNGKEEQTKNGKIIVASNVEVKDDTTVNTYTIKETQSPDNYYLYDGVITLKVKMTKVDNTYTLTNNGVTLETSKENSGVTFKVEGSTIKVYVPNIEKPFDLALRKYISKINGIVVEPSREPVINEQSIKMLEKTGTASYYHAKNSIAVRVGDEIEYTIRVYNEGEILGFAKQITDYLPEGLSFVRLSEDNSKEFTTTSEVGSKVVVINYSGNTLIKSLRDFIGKEVKVTNEYYQQVKIICKVENSEQVYITNRGEITNYGYNQKDENGNVIWKEATQVGNVDIDSVQNTIKGELNLNTWYENAKENTFVDENGNKVVDKNYYPGSQDDDDFETVEVLTGKYNVIIKKVDSANTNSVLQGAHFTVKGSNIESELKVGPTSTNGEVTALKGVSIKNEQQVDTYTIKETVAPKNYKAYDENITLQVKIKFNGTSFVIDEKNTTVNGKNVKMSVNKDNTTVTVIVPNEKKEYDLSLRKFITEINGKELAESREPQVDVSKLINGESTTATYTHPKNTVDVNTSEIVTYTIRVYNEGEVDGYASRIMDDVPEGLIFVPATFDANGKPTNINAQYRWTLYKEATSSDKVDSLNSIKYDNKTYVITDNVEEADVIVTDYLSKENGENNLIKAFDSKTMKTLDYKDVKVSFKVIEPTKSDRILINYAQITESTDSEGNITNSNGNNQNGNNQNGNTTPDRDSTPNEWIEGEDDQDIEKVKVRYFDLSLLKWVTKAIVYENGIETITETGHTGYENPEPIVKVDLKNTSINNVEVKFEYKIRITNEGQIAGYAKEISDYIPEGLKFIPADNPEWREVEGKIVTRKLENTLLQPGEYADVTVLLTWINNENNLGLKVNTAEISEDYNEFGTPDIDSTPNNKEKGEDDIDDAPIMLAIRTGRPIVYTGLAVGVLSIISLGAVVIRKRVL